MQTAKKILPKVFKANVPWHVKSEAFFHLTANISYPLMVLLSSDMARGALDNFAANQGIADFSWGASLWAELGLLVGALALPPAGVHLVAVATVVSVVETLRALARYLRAPAPAPRAVAAPVPAPAPARAAVSAAPAAAPDRR